METGHSITKTVMSEINGSAEVKLTVTLVLNASLSWLERPAVNSSNTQWGTSVPLSILVLISLTMNLCLVLTIYTSYSLKRVSFNLLILSTSMACFVESSLNIPTAVYYVKTGSWQLGATLCSFNAACILIVSLEITWGIAAMCVERWVTMSKPSQTKRLLPVWKQSVVIATLWFVGAVLTLPLVTGLVETRAFPTRYSCSIADNYELTYRCVLVICYILPCVIALTSLVTSFIKTCKEKHSMNKRKKDMTYTELFFEESYLWNEWTSSKFVGIIALLYATLQLPYIVSQNYTLMSARFVKPELPQQNTTLSLTLPITQVTSDVDTVCTWLRYVFASAFPLAIFVMRKDIRRKCHSFLVSWRQSSIITDLSPDSTGEPLVNSDAVAIPSGKRKASTVTCLTTPIVFATSKGSFKFHFLDVQADVNSEFKKSKSDNTQTAEDVPDYLSLEHRFMNFVCDVDDYGTHIEEWGTQGTIEDITEDEIDSSEHVIARCHSVREVAVQTVGSGETSAPQIGCSVLKTNYYPNKHEAVRFKNDSRSPINKQKRPKRKMKFSKTLVTNRNYSSFGPLNSKRQQRSYATSPRRLLKNKECRNKTMNLEIDRSGMGLLSALRIKADFRPSSPNVLIPRSTGELLDVIEDTRETVSL